MKKHFKNIILIFILLLVVFNTWQVCQAQETESKLIIEDYPSLDGISLSERTSVPELIKYIFLFALGIVGFIALLSFMIAAVQYVTSAGNASKATDAKDRIMSALLGIGLLLTSVVLLRIINPDLINLDLEDNKTIPIDIASTSGPDECRFLKAYWDKEAIDVRDYAALILTYNEQCDDSQNLIVKWNKPLLRQERPKGFNSICDNYYVDITQLAEANQVQIVYHFDGDCRDKFGITECPSIPIIGKLLFKDKNGMCNWLKGQPEEIYAEGSFILKNGETQYVPRVSITVKDYR